MKRIPIFFLFILCSSFLNLVEAQNPSYQQKLFYTCKVWGFVKYFHSNVSTGGVNWDSVLIADFPLVKSSITDSEFNNALDTMLNVAGPMAITHTPPCDTVPPERSRNLNFGWINNPILRPDVQTILDTIRNNFRPHAEYWVEVNPNQADGGYLKFNGGDSLILNINDESQYPDEWHRLLEVFAHWNIINYFNPYNYLQNQPWDSTLYQNILNIDTAANDAAFFTAFKKITSNMDDAHVQYVNYDYYSYSPISGYYAPNNLVLKYILGKYLVVKSGVPGLTLGDQIISINGLPTKQWEDSLSPYISAGDSAAFHYFSSIYMIEEGDFDPISITYYDSVNTIHTISTTCISYQPYQSYYQNDTLASVQWRYWSNCNIGYINNGEMEDVGTDVSTMYAALQNTNAIIIDIRNYPVSNAIWDLVDDYLYPYGATPVAKGMLPNVNYPGTYYWEYNYAFPGSHNPYTGKIIILFNEMTVSAAENECMMLGELPNTIMIGSQTQGTDGNVTYYNLSQRMTTGFTSLGWFYPNGDSTERVGIIPDIVMYPTQEGIRQGRDELLEKALEVAGCPLSVPTLKNYQPSMSVYPNPNNGVFTLNLQNATEPLQIDVYNMLGEIIYSESLPQAHKGALNTICLSSQPNGIYLYRILSQDGSLFGSGKLVIQK